MTQPDLRGGMVPALALCLALSAMLAACSKAPSDVIPGYVEADYTRLAAPVAGRLVTLKVTRGDEVQAGTPLFTLDQDQEQAAVEEAAARVRKQDASAADLAKGKRREEIAVLEAQERQAAAQLALSEADLKRQQELAAKGFISGANLDSIRTRVRADSAKLAEVRANLQVARLAARSDTRLAAEADTAAARAVLAQNEWRRDQKSVAAPVTGRIDDTLYRQGEWVPAGSPVVSMLGPSALKLRFFVPQSRLAQFHPGTTIYAHCDGCGEPFSAKVSFVAKSAEFNPPVIYSKDNRSRLVFLVEARPDQPSHLNPGQPLDIALDATSLKSHE